MKNKPIIIICTKYFYGLFINYLRSIKHYSGGQLQRACICRSMIMNPEIIYADEPTGALNRTSAMEVMEAFLGINREGATIMMVTHDSWIASKCERIIYLLDGRFWMVN